MKVISKDRIEPQTGVAFELKRGQFLRVIDPEGEQVSELTCYNVSDVDEWLCSGRTLGNSRSWQIRQNDILYSNRSTPMLSLLEDTCGRHDFLMGPCNQEMFAIHDQHETTHASCYDNLCTSLMGWEIDPDEIHTTLSLFLNAVPQPDGSIKVAPPLSKAGDYILLRAEMNLVIGLTACAAADYTNGSYKPILYEILEEDN